MACRLRGLKVGGTKVQLVLRLSELDLTPEDLI